MNKIEIRTKKANNKPNYSTNLDNVIVFLRHEEDKIVIKNNKQIEVEIYDNGELVFCGSREDFFNKLKGNSPIE
jgi:hypothetical protein